MMWTVAATHPQEHLDQDEEELDIKEFSKNTTVGIYSHGL